MSEPSERAKALVSDMASGMNRVIPLPEAQRRLDALHEYIARLEAVADAARRIHVQVLRRGWDESNEKLGNALAALDSESTSADGDGGKP